MVPAVLERDYINAAAFASTVNIASLNTDTEDIIEVPSVSTSIVFLPF